MSLLRRYRCVTCAATHAPDATRWRCDCGGWLDLEPPINGPLPANAQGIWRWAQALPFSGDSVWPSRVMLGEGATPIATVNVGGRSAIAKLEFLSPTLSFKDRGAVVLVAVAAEVGAARLVADSSGNAGTALAAYAGRARLPIEVFVAAATSPAKLAQLRAHGAVIRAVDGDRSAVQAAAVERVARGDAFYASHVFNPFFWEGTKTFAFEVWEQLGHRLPHTIVVPVGNGTLAFGVHRGCRELLSAGLVDRVPRLVGVQAAGCAPIAAAFAAGATEVAPVAPEPTIATGIAIGAPPRGTELLGILDDVVTVTDDEISAAQDELAAQGLFVEPTAATPAAALAKVDPTDVVIPLSGAGLKAVAS